MDEVKTSMMRIEEKKTRDDMTHCASFMEPFLQQLPSMLCTTRVQADGGIYLPIEKGCAKQALDLLTATYGIQHSTMTSPKNVCIRVALTEDLSQLHAVPFSYSCEYVKRVFNQ
jgi:hypothetical protein